MSPVGTILQAAAIVLLLACGAQARPEGPATRGATAEELGRYSWLDRGTPIRSLAGNFSPPAGAIRVAVVPDSFAAYLRGLPLRGAGAPVRAHDGRVLHAAGDRRVAAVAEIDTGKRDLQQCADSILRLHAEWMWWRGAREKIAYRFTSGDLAAWERWEAGERPVVAGARVTWARRTQRQSDYAAFRAYLDTVFTYAGTISLTRDSVPVARGAVAAGDFFVAGGSPGHAVLVLDVARDPRGRTWALLGQGFMPAQDFHVLASADGSAWFPLDDAGGVKTPFWPKFPWSSLRRLPE